MTTTRWKIADTETAGFKGPDADGSGVAEVAWIEIDEHCNELDRRSSLINPGRHIEEGASEVHGLYDVDVAQAPKLGSYYAANWDDRPTVVICHNVPFDIKFLAEHITFLKGTICTLALARQYIKDSPNHKLPTLAEHLGLERGTAHRAAGDCITTLALLRVIVAMTGRTLPQLLQLGQKPQLLTTMPFGKHKGKAFHDLPGGYLEWILSVKDDMPADVVYSANLARSIK